MTSHTCIVKLLSTNYNKTFWKLDQKSFDHLNKTDLDATSLKKKNDVKYGMQYTLSASYPYEGTIQTLNLVRHSDLVRGEMYEVTFKIRENCNKSYYTAYIEHIEGK